MSDDHEPPEYEEPEKKPDFDASPNAWERDNITYRNMRDSRVRARDVIVGRDKALVLHGPPGVGKSYGVLRELRTDAHRRKQVWKQMELDDPERRKYTRLVEGIEEFIVPFHRAHGRITPIQLYARFCQWRSAGYTVMCDDLRILVTDPAAQGLLQDATDKEADYEIRWETNRGEVTAMVDDRITSFPAREYFHAGLLILNNHPPSSSKSSLIMETAVRNRLTTIEFTWRRADVGIYVDRMAFQPRKDAGLWRYLVGHTYGPMHSRGLGFTGLDGEATDILRDVRRFYHAHFLDVEVIGFRFLERVLRDRYYHPKDWEDLALNHLMPSH